MNLSRYLPKLWLCPYCGRLVFYWRLISRTRYGPHCVIEAEEEERQFKLFLKTMEYPRCRGSR
jgi:hypothetical protein